MSLSRICTAIWFLIYGIAFFAGFPATGVILAILALIIGIAMLVGR